MIKLVSFILSVLFGLFGGYVFSVLWGYFVVPKFGLPALSPVDGVGLMMVASFPTLKMQLQEAFSWKKDGMSDEVFELWKMIAVDVIVYPATLLAGYVWHLFLN